MVVLHCAMLAARHARKRVGGHGQGGGHTSAGRGLMGKGPLFRAIPGWGEI
jgi:hypothetical protein